MLIFAHEEESVIAATPKDLFDILGDPRRHAELAGSGEVKSVRLRGGGPIASGSTFEADEEIRFGRRTMKFTAISTIVTFEPPAVISWTSMPPNRPRPRRIQWWYRLEPTEGGTRVTHRVEVDLGPVPNVVMKLPYSRMRAPALRDGMRRTLDNLARAASAPGRPGQTPTPTG
jgi:hypothetical protein